jgi:hypothetical protein
MKSLHRKCFKCIDLTSPFACGAALSNVSRSSTGTGRNTSPGAAQSARDARMRLATRGEGCV